MDLILIYALIVKMLSGLVLLIFCSLGTANDQNWEYDSHNTLSDYRQIILDRRLDWILDCTRIQKIEILEWLGIDKLTHDGFISISCTDGLIGLPNNFIQRNGPANIFVQGDTAVLEATLSLGQMEFKYKSCIFWDPFNTTNKYTVKPRGIIKPYTIKLQISWDTTRGIKCQPILDVVSVSEIGKVLVEKPKKVEPLLNDARMRQVVHHVNISAIKAVSDLIKPFAGHMIHDVNLCSIFNQFTTNLFAAR